MSIFRNAYDALQDACFIWRQEMKQVVKDEGVLIFFIIVPLVYPLLYSWIYNNEVVRDVPVAVVDQSHSHLSRQFLRHCDASPDVRIAYYATDLDEAKSLVSRQLVKGVYLIPADFAERVNRMQQATISVYCDMSLMLTYKAIYQTAQMVSMDMGAQIQTKLGGHFTGREEQIAARPLDYEEVPVFSPGGGYGSFILPGVLMLILQQTLVLGIGLAAGTSRESNRNMQLVPINIHYHGLLRIVLGKAMAYFMIYCVMGAWLVVGVPRLFHFPQLAHWPDLLMLMSVPLLFLTGVSWPQSSIPGFWQGISWLFPSTFGVRAYVRLNSMGATLTDVLPEYYVLYVQALVYFLLACIVYRYQKKMSRKQIRARLSKLKRQSITKMTASE